MAREGLTVSVDVERLRGTLQANRAQHTDAYEKAKAGYIKVMKQRLGEYVDQLANGEVLAVRYLDPPPDDHTNDYDDAIQMMLWSQESTIELTQAQFKQYVQDDWGWKDSWLTSNTAYLQA